MAFDGVPFALGSGASVTDAVARTLVNAATRDSEGVLLPGNMKVTALGSPGPSVNVAAGSCVIRNVQSPGQSYIGRASSTTSVPISANTSGASRSDLILARIRDPAFSPWSPYVDPTQIANGPYFEPFVVSGVSNTTTKASQVVSYSAIALARLDIPNGTTNITGGMIVDLRQLAQPRNKHDTAVQQVVGSGNMYVLVTDTTYKDWPPSNNYTVTVPTWATTATVRIEIKGLRVDHPCDINLRVNMSGSVGVTNFFDYNGNPGAPTSFVESVPFNVYGVFDVSGLQGQSVTFKPQAQRATPVNNGNCYVDSTQQVVFDIYWDENTV